jgi:tight adherence protein B
MNLWLIAILSLAGISAAGLAWALLSAISESSKEATGVYESEITHSLEAMFLFIPARKLVDLSFMLSTTVFMLVMLPFCRTEPTWLIPAGLIISLLPASAAFFLPKWLINHLKARRLERFNLQLLEVLPMMSNALRAGFSINQAFESVVENSDNPIKQEITLFLQQLRVGVSFSEALAAFDERVGSEDLTLICTAIDIARKSGGNLTEVFDTIADTIRARLRIQQHIKTLTAQGRLQGLIIGAMPFLLGIGMFIFKPGLMKPFVCSIIGGITIIGVTALVAVGGLIIRKIVTIDI